MLVISRKPGERVHIGEEIQVAILEITGSRVVIGIAAPREVAIRRVGPLPYEPAATAGDPPDDGGADAQPTGAQFEYSEVDAESPPVAAKRVPVVRVKRSRLKAAVAPG